MSTCLSVFLSVCLSVWFPVCLYHSTDFIFKAIFSFIFILYSRHPGAFSLEQNLDIFGDFFRKNKITTRVSVNSRQSIVFLHYKKLYSEFTVEINWYFAASTIYRKITYVPLLQNSIFNDWKIFQNIEIFFCHYFNFES